MKDEEINEKIHVEIMGEKCWHSRLQRPNCEIYCSKCGIYLGKYNVKKSLRNPNYCQNISDAFRVVEKLKEQKFRLCLIDTSTETQAELIRYGKTTSQDEWYSASVKDGANRPAKAICLAALKTLE